MYILSIYPGTTSIARSSDVRGHLPRSHHATKGNHSLIQEYTPEAAAFVTKHFSDDLTTFQYPSWSGYGNPPKSWKRGENTHVGGEVRKQKQFEVAGLFFPNAFNLERGYEWFEIPHWSVLFWKFLVAYTSGSWPTPHSGTHNPKTDSTTTAPF